MNGGIWKKTDEIYRLPIKMPSFQPVSGKGIRPEDPWKRPPDRMPCTVDSISHSSNIRPFLLDSREASGLGLTTGDLGLIYGTIGIIALSIGGIIGGIAASRRGMKYWLWWMVAAMNLPNLVYVFLSYVLPSSLWIVGASVAVEQFGYGFGFTAYMLYMIYISEGKHKTAHFALTTGFMALGMMLPGMISGWLQEWIGYQHFFIWVMLCTIPGFVVIPFLKIDPGFGKKEK